MTIPITDKFEASSGKGNFKLTWPEEMDAGAFDVALTMALGGSLSASGTDGEIIIQTGATGPVHNASQSVLYWDTVAKKLYVNNDGTTGWTEVGSGAGATGPTGPQGPIGQTGPAGTTIHNELTNLDADDHTQYLLLLGRGGGQALVGGTTPAATLTLHSTFDVTKGIIYLGQGSDKIITGTSSSVNEYKMLIKARGSNFLIDTNIIDVSGSSVLIHASSNSTGRGSSLAFNADSNNTNVGASIFHERTGTASTGKLHFATKNSAITGEDIPIQMTINEVGSVGIGTVNPTHALHISSTGVDSSIFIDGQTGVDGIIFPDRTIQTTAATEGPTGPAGPVGSTPTITISRFAEITVPTATDEIKMGYFCEAATVTEIRGSTDSGSVIFNLFYQSKTNPGATGVAILTSNIEAGATGADHTQVGFSTTSIPAESFLTYRASGLGTTGVPSLAWINMCATVD